MTSDPIIEIRDLQFTWRGQSTPTLDIGLLTVSPGERIFIHGPSGSGKSTLLGLLGGVLVPERGTISVLGSDLRRMPAAARDRFRSDHVGFVFQLFNLVPYLPVLDNVMLGRHHLMRTGYLAAALWWGRARRSSSSARTLTRSSRRVSSSRVLADPSGSAGSRRTASAKNVTARSPVATPAAAQDSRVFANINFGYQVQDQDLRQTAEFPLYDETASWEAVRDRVSRVFGIANFAKAASAPLEKQVAAQQCFDRHRTRRAFLGSVLPEIPAVRSGRGAASALRRAPSRGPGAGVGGEAAAPARRQEVK